MPDVTILITCYRQEPYLFGALDSAQDQVVPEIYKQKQHMPMPTFTVKHFIDKTGLGASTARNIAIQNLVTTPWVVLLDADDTLPSHFLWYMWAHKKLAEIDNKKVFVGSPVQFIEGLRKDRLFYEGKHTGADFSTYCPCATISGLFSVAAWQNVGGFDPEMKALNDWDLWIRLARGGYLYKHCKDTFVLRRGDVPGSITRNGMSSEENSKAILKAFNDKHGTELTTYPQGYTIPARPVNDNR